MVLDAGNVAIALIAGVIVLVIIRHIQTRRPIPNYPPGPWGIPVFGSFLQFLLHNPYFKTYLGDVRKKYGDVFSLKIGERHVVIVNGMESIKEALVTRGDDISDKPKNYVISQFNPDFLGFVNAQFGDRWYQQRQHAVRVLRGYGFGKSSFEGKIMEEAKCLLDYLKNIQGKRVNLNNYISNCIVNIIFSLTFGKRYSHFDNPAFLEAVTCIQDWAASWASMVFQLGNFLPFTRPFLFRYVVNVKETTSKLYQSLSKQISRKTEQFQFSNEPGDFIESYLLEMKKDTEGKYNDEYLKFIVVDLFAAGMETVATTLYWAILYMVLNPDIQEKVQDELDEVIGKERFPTWSDRTNLPYTEATLREVQRIASVVPVTPHSTTTQTTLRGYTIPKGYRVWINLWSIHHDPHIYPEPEKFDPGRFLTEDGKLKKANNFLPFGAGSRVCMGESLAKLELFLFFSTMLQQFSFSVPEGSCLPTVKGYHSIVHKPHSFDVIFKARI